jgi:hypothetical protein
VGSSKNDLCTFFLLDNVSKATPLATRYLELFEALGRTRVVRPYGASVFFAGKSKI